MQLILGQKSGSKSARTAKLRQFWKGHPKPAFSETVQREDQGKLFKNRLKSSPRLKGPKSLWRKCHYPRISMHLKCKDWRRFWGKKAAAKVPEWPSYGNFCKVTQNPHYLKKKFFKNRPKSSPRLEGPKPLWRKWYYPLISMHLRCKDCRRFWRRRRIQNCPNGQVMAIFARSPKTHIF